jgi:predicted aspartyl protease
MESATMGRVLTEATIENLADLFAVIEGRLAPEQVRRVTIPDALVDTGATLLSLPTRIIKQLGLYKQYSKKVTSSVGQAEVNVYGVVRLTIQDRQCPLDVAEVPDSVPVLVGQVPLELLDFVVDPKSQKLIGNPAHGGEHMFDMY